MSASKGIRDRDPVILLDPEKVRAARIRSGIAETALGGALGVATNVIRNLEHGSDQRYFTLVFVRDLARAVGVDAAELMSDDRSQRPALSSADHCEPTDVNAVGAVLAETQAVIAVDSLAAGLGWTVARTLTALEQLDERLLAVGQRLQWVHDCYVCLTSDGANSDAVEAVAKRGVAELGFKREEVQLLARLATVGPNNRFAELPRFALGHLTATGYVEAGVLPEKQRDPKKRKAEGARLTELARFNLVLD